MIPSNSTRHFQTTPQRQRCMLSILYSWCTSVTSKVKLFIVLCLFCFLVVSVDTLANAFSWNNSIPVRVTQGNSHFDNYLNSRRNQEPLKIAIWTSPNLDFAEYRTDELKKLIVGIENQKPCFRDKFKCKMTMNMNIGELQTADAIIFFMFNKGFLMNELPPGWEQWRKPDQIWVLHAHEAPPQIPSQRSNLPEVFNWTISYRRDSDIWLPYGRVVPIEQTRSKENLTKPEIFIGNISLSKWISGKSKLVAGVITNCDTSSRRERIVQQLKKTGKPVHIYGDGDCSDGKVNCNFYLQNCTDVWSQIGANYKFYLAFENSLCLDYITEKFWRTLELGMVPVVYGGANYSKVMPSGSFIDVRDFGSPDELMSYLEELEGNDTEYAKYFEWRRQFKLAEGNSWNNGNAWCELCEKLRKFGDNATNSTGTLQGSQNTFRKILSAQVAKNWWKEGPHKNSNGEKNACQNPNDFKRFLGRKNGFLNSIFGLFGW